MRCATITSKGQITIPKEVRDSLNISAGDKVDFFLTGDGEAILRPVTRSVDEAFGILSHRAMKKVETENMDEELRKGFRRKHR